MTTEQRTAEAAQEIVDALLDAGFDPTMPYESGNTQDGWTFNVKVDGKDYNVEIVAEQI